MKRKLNTGRERLVYYLKVMKTSLQYPCRTFVLKYIYIKCDSGAGL